MPVAVLVLHGLDDELARDPLANPLLLQADGHILRIDVRAEVGDREIGPSEDVYEGKRPDSARIGAEIQNRVESTVPAELEQRFVGEETAGVQNVVANERDSVVAREEQG